MRRNAALWEWVKQADGHWYPPDRSRPRTDKSAWPDRTIYAIKHHGCIIYVGQSAKPEERFITHCKRTFKSLNEISLWKIRVCKAIDAERIESQVINSFRKKGLKLFNIRPYLA